MLEMKNCTDIAFYEKYIPQDCIAPLILESVDGDKISGFIIFEYDKDEVVIFALEYGDDIALCDGLVRAAMFKAYLSGIKNARFELCSDKAVECCKKLRFIKDDKSSIDIDDILNKCKGCKGS